MNAKTIKKEMWITFAFLSSLLLKVDCQSAPLPLVSGDRIVFMGDSIPDQQMWPHYVTAYLILGNPSLDLHCQTEARGGTSLEQYLDTSGTSYSQYSRRVFPYEPDYVFIAGTTNGGVTKVAHKAVMQTLVNNYIGEASSAVPVMIGMIPLPSLTGYTLAGDYDDANEEIALTNTPNRLFHKTWRELAPRFTEAKIITANSSTDAINCTAHGFGEGLPVIFSLSVNPAGPTGISSDVRYYVRDVSVNSFRVAMAPGGTAVDILTNGTGTNYASNVWPIIRRLDYQFNGDHPGAPGQIVYAWKLITGLGWTTDVSTAVIDGGAATLTSQNHCTVTGLSVNTQGGVDFLRLDALLPWAIDEEGRAGAEFLFPSIRSWQNYSLSVTGLDGGNYEILCDGEIIGVATNVTLASGWNMADLSSGPVWRQCQEVLGRIRDMHDRARTYPYATLHTGSARVGVEKYRGAVDYAYQTGGKRGANLIADANVQSSLHRNLRAVGGIDISTNMISHSNHGYQDGQLLRISTTNVLPAPLTTKANYYVRDKTAAGYRMAVSSGGTPIDLTTVGSGTMSVYAVDNIDDMDGLIRAAAQPVIRSYSIRRQDVTPSNATVALGDLLQTYDSTPKAATAITNPVGLTVNFTYNGSATTPTLTGSYTVVGTINDPIYTGSATGTLVIAKAGATVAIGSLSQIYDGTPKAATATTNLGGLTVNLTYNGSATAPTAAGSYTVVGTIDDANYSGSGTNTLLISGPAMATITLANLAQTYDGTAKAATVTTIPNGLAVIITYNGSTVPPTNRGSYTVVATINDPNYSGSATNTLVIAERTITGYEPPLGIPAPLWGGLDPINVRPPPRPGGWPSAAVVGYYYINNTASGATDTNNPYGYPSKPRLTIPETTYAAGSYVEIHGGPYTHAWGDSDWDMTFAGTEANPCWVTGTSETIRTEIRGQLKIAGSYAIFQWLRNTYDTVNSRLNQTMIGGDPKLADHICLRSCTLAGDGVHHAGFGTNLQIVGTSSVAETNHIVIYDVESKDADSFDYVKTTAEDDNHGAQVGFYTNNIWFLKFKSHNNAGDGMQVSGNNAIGEARVHRLFIGDSEFYHNAENSGIDMKSSLDVIISHNRIGDCSWSFGGGGGSLCITQDEGGDGCDNIWIIFNEMYDAVNPLRVEGRSTNVYLLGNVIRDMSDSSVPATYVEDGYSGFVTRSNNLCTPRIIDNTFVKMASSGLRWKAVGSPPQLRIHGNIFALRTKPGGWDIWGQGQDVGVLLDYTLYDMTAPRMFFSTTYTSFPAWRSGNPRGWDAHSRAAAPGFHNAAGNDYRIKAGSAAIDASIEDPAYATFEARYGINIRKDIAGTPRPNGNGWDIGAYEHTSGLVPPTGIRVDPLQK